MEVTILIPTYNGGQFLGETLATVRHQTYRNFNLVISDDDSTDDTLKIIRSFRATVNFPVYVLEHDRLGLVPNWNYGIEFIQHYLPQTQYLKLLCQDDVLYSDCLAEMVNFCQMHPQVGMVFSRRSVIGQLPPQLSWLRDLTSHWQQITPLQSGLAYFSDPHFLAPPDNKIGEPSNVLINMAVFDRLGLFDPQFHQYCDLEMWLRIMANFPVGFIDRELSSFRVHPHQTTWQNEKNDRVWAEIYAVWCKVLSHPHYQQVPTKVKNRILLHIFSQLGRECFRIIKHWRPDRFPAVLFWLGQSVYARFISPS
ncbi:MAG: glycosyltransferase [Pseudanabaenaceae cyanobacterium SKYGB_i_bin29]|nr:glycosyltransferase [Pseudanabaenaceae cyanobacterium SKYG29]MDW8420746.1 glycosyltransferase [Pseudanabaenaceae cyanobacterium SKYGB_i_bin29]